MRDLGTIQQAWQSLFGKKKKRNRNRDWRVSRLKFEQLEDRRMLAVLSVGSGDGAVQVDVDGYGSFGRAQDGTAFQDALIDSIGPGGQVGLIFESGTAIGAGGNRQFLTDGAIGSSGFLPTVNLSVTPDGSAANSTFLLSGLTGSLSVLNGLSVELVQELSPIMDNSTQVGALLSQTYAMTNTTSSAMPLNLVRYIDVDVDDTGTHDGGGRIVLGGEEWFVTTGSDVLTDIAQADKFVAISTEGGIEPLSGRFEVDQWDSVLQSTIIPGGNLNDLVYNDSTDPDELIDIATYDTTGALRSNYQLAPGATAAYTTYTVFAEGVPSDLLTDAGGIVNAPPQVTNVTISGSNSTHTPFSFNDPNDDVNDFDGSGIQLRTVPVGGADRVAIQFSEHVTNVAAGSLTLTGLKTHVVPTLATTGGFNYDVGSHTATWTFDAPLAADQYVISLSDAVTDVGGNQLDGEWTNPFSIFTTDLSVSEFPSGDGSEGGDFNFVFTILPGDASLDNDVDGGDYVIYMYFRGGTFEQADYNGDGVANSADNAFWQANYGNDLSFLFYADFDGDGDVDGDDLVIWQNNQGTGTDHDHGDADNDGDVDGNDFLFWSYQFGLELKWVA